MRYVSNKSHIRRGNSESVGADLTHFGKGRQPVVFVTNAVELPSALDSLWEELEDFLKQKQRKETKNINISR